VKRSLPWLLAWLPAMALAGDSTAEFIDLPKPRTDGTAYLERVLEERRTVRTYTQAPLGMDQAAQLLWAAQGITRMDGRRTAPSAGGLYPLQVYLVGGQVMGLAPGVYRYQPAGHRLRRIASGDRRSELAAAALGQSWIAAAPAILVFGATLPRTTRKYGARGVRYVHMEAGHAAQNVLLQAEALGLGAAVVGAFNDDRVTSLLGLGGEERPLYLLPVGGKKD